MEKQEELDLNRIIYNSIPKTQNTFLLISNSLNVYLVLSNYLLDMKSHQLYLFLNFQQTESKEINYHLKEKKKQLFRKGILFNEKSELKKISASTKEKRNQIYVDGGAWTVTSNILILDLLSKAEIHPKIINKIFIKEVQFIKNFEHILPWIVHLITKQNKQTQIIIVSKNLSALKKNSFQQLYYMFFMRKVVLWPFGRSQVLKRIKGQYKKFEQFEHAIHFTNFEERIQQILTNLLKYADQRLPARNGEQISYFNIFMKERYSNFDAEQLKNRNQFWNMFQIRSLMSKLVNFRPNQLFVNLLNSMNTTNTHQIWISANEKIDAEIQQMIRILKKQIWELKISQSSRIIDLRLKDYNDFKCSYQLKYLYPHTKKFDTLIKILDELNTKQKYLSKQKVTVWIHVSNQKVKQYLSEELFEYFHRDNKILQLKSLYNVLKTTAEERAVNLKRIIQKKSKSINDNILQNQNVLLEEFYQELQTFYQTTCQFEISNAVEQCQDSQKFKQNIVHHQNRLKSFNFKYICLEQLNFRDLYSPNKDLVYKQKFQIIVNASEEIPLLSQFLRQHKPSVVIIHSPNLLLMRFLYVSQIQMNIEIQEVHAINVKQSIQESLYIGSAFKEDNNFWEISKHRPNLRVDDIDSTNRVKIVKIQQNVSTRQGKGAEILRNMDISKLKSMEFESINKLPQRTFYILVDKRQFRSPLPSALYHAGFEIVPIFMETSDYILSNQVAVERKAVDTHDIHQSLKSGRLDEQLKRMSAKFKNPYLLVEFSNIESFKRNTINLSYNHMKNQYYNYNVNKGIMTLLKKYPKVRILWSRSCQDTIEIFTLLKKKAPQPDISYFSKNQAKVDENELFMNESKTLEIDV